jgi:hypothetical protein
MQSRYLTNDSNICFEWIAAKVIIISFDRALPPDLADKSIMSVGSFPRFWGEMEVINQARSKNELQSGGGKMSLVGKIGAGIN